MDARTLDTKKTYDSYLTWDISKVENTQPAGINKLTLNQSQFNPNSDGQDPISGFWYADYIVSTREAANDFDANEGMRSDIEYTGNPTIKVKGTGKQLKLVFHDVSGNVVQREPGEEATLSSYWSFVVTDDNRNVFLDYDEFQFFASKELLDAEVARRKKAKEPEIKNYVYALNGDVYNIKVHTSDYNLIDKTLHLHGHYYDGTCDSEIAIRLVSL